MDRDHVYVETVPLWAARLERTVGRIDERSLTTAQTSSQTSDMVAELAKRIASIEHDRRVGGKRATRAWAFMAGAAGSVVTLAAQAIGGR